MKKHLTTIILVLLFFFGLSLLLYPRVADYWNSFHQSRAINSYIERVSKIDNSVYDQIISSAREYNRSLGADGFRWFLTDEQREEYNSELNLDDNGVMGYITIDKINIQLPIYHGTKESVLQTSIGHIEWSSLPVGVSCWDSKARDGMYITDPTEGSHCVLSAHRGLPSARLFSDLDKLVEGDTFSLNILGETLTYQVDQIRVVVPSDLSELQIVSGKDYCSLVTCTPYGVNTHRLLVRGHRVNNPQGDIKVVSEAIQYKTVYIAPVVALPIILILLVLMMISTGRQRTHNRARSAAYDRYTDQGTITVIETDLDEIARNERLRKRRGKKDE